MRSPGARAFTRFLSYVSLPPAVALLACAVCTAATSCATTGEGTEREPVEVEPVEVDRANEGADAAAEEPAAEAAIEATVKIRSTHVGQSYFYPWEAESDETSWGSGVLIEGGRILTNAHVVADIRYLTVERAADPHRYEAEVLFAGHDCDLALIRVNDPAFREGMEPLPLASGLPPLRSTVATFGYPIGGSALSVTEGVVSRIDVETYVHDGDRSFLAIQTDAAINPGNSGGAVVLDGEMVGIAFQYQQEAENLGYAIPVPVIRRFLADVEDGTYDGFPELGVVPQGLESPALRSYLGMAQGESGVLVSGVAPGGTSEGRLHEGEVILSVDGRAVANDGTVAMDGGRWPLTVYVSLKWPGEKLRVEVMSPGRRIRRVSIG